jgi:hypothetical protein
MIRFRVDDYPGTKPNEFYRHNLENFKKFDEVMTRHGARYVLGIIPAYASEADCRWIGSRPHIEPALHGVNHDERFPNEFREHLTEREVYLILRNEKGLLEEDTGREVNIYIPPHNVVDTRTVNALVQAGFKELFVGPETDPAVMSYAADRMKVIKHSPPHRYGRSDEFIARGTPAFCRSWKDPGEMNIGLHWTWEWNIGLENLDCLLGQLRGII